MSNFKAYGAIAVMIGCFVVVYPRFMHPIVANIFGFGESARKSNQDANPAYPPGHVGSHPSQKGGQGGAHPEEMRRHMRHGPHPGMRAAAEMQRQQGQHGSGRGMMGVVLPMYAVGIVLYLGYTLYKVFNKSNNKNNDGNSRYSWDKTSRHSREKDRMGFPKDYDGTTPDVRNFLYDQEHRQNLEDLLTRVDDKNVSMEEMKVLQKRLEETESQMTRILQAMRGINTNVDNLTAAENESALDQGDNAGVEEITEDSQTQEGDKVKDGDDGETGNDEGQGKEEQAGEEENLMSENGEDDDEDDLDAAADEEEEAVDEIIKERSDDDDPNNDMDTNNTSAVRQRNVKSNEQ